jgi:hypothetical protein
MQSAPISLMRGGSDIGIPITARALHPTIFGSNFR